MKTMTGNILVRIEYQGMDFLWNSIPGFVTPFIMDLSNKVDVLVWDDTQNELFQELYDKLCANIIAHFRIHYPEVLELDDGDLWVEYFELDESETENGVKMGIRII
jgi:hypothetical protein